MMGDAPVVHIMKTTPVTCCDVSSAMYGTQKATLARGDTARRMQLGDMMYEEVPGRPDNILQINILSRKSKTNQVR